MMDNFQQQINEVVDSEKSHEDKIKEITELGVEQIIELLEIKNSECIVSIRERSGYKNSHMRLYYSSDKYKKVMNVRTKKTEVTKKYFEQDKNNTHDKVNGKLYYSNIYSLEDCGVNDPLEDNEESFKFRIDGFLTKCIEEDSNHEEDLKKLKSCIVIGKNFSKARYQQSITNEEDHNQNSEWVDQIVVIYSTLNCDSIKEKYPNIIRIIEIVFRSLDTIRTYELIEFEREALNVISEIAPKISKGTVSASEAINTVTRALKKLLESHLESISETGSLNVFFIQVCERKVDKSEQIMPTFRILPEVKVDKETSIQKIFHFSQDISPSISKYLLYRKVINEEKSEKVSSAFLDIFKDINDEKVNITENEIFSLLVTNSDSEYWKLNQNISVNDEKQLGSIAVYALANNSSNIENKKVISSNSMISFESTDNPYLFSDELVSLLSHSVTLVSSIFKTIRMGDLTTDYRADIRRAYHIYNSDTICDECVNEYGLGSFRYDLSRINWRTAGDFSAAYLEQGYHSAPLNEKDYKKITNFFFELSQLINNINDKNPEELHLIKLEILNSDKSKPVTLFKELDNSQKIYIIDFLKHCPSDVIWHCWFGAIRAVLESRYHYHHESNGDSKLTFLIPPISGYSAVELLMVGATGEIAQVIKLGQLDKLKKEKENYQEYVRYRILYAARIPHDGFAYECDGTGNNQYGALVSDLVTGEDKSLSTLLSHTSPDIKDKKNEIEIVDLRDAISHLFESNLKPWYQDNTLIKKMKERIKNQIETGNDLIIVDSRCTEKIQTIHAWSDLYNELNKGNLSNKLNQVIIEFLHKKDKGQQNHISEVVDSNFFSKMKLNSDDHFNDLQNVFKPSVIHGDLNSKNLIWSEDHKRFFIIDFERIKDGFYGADQIFLFSSMICDIEAIKYFNVFCTKNNNDALWRDFILLTIDSIYALKKFLAEINNTAKENKETKKEIETLKDIIDSHWIYFCKKETELSFYNKEIIVERSTVESSAKHDISRRFFIYKDLLLSIIQSFEKGSVGTNPPGFTNFWMSAFRGYAVTQLSYALKNLYCASNRHGSEINFEESLNNAVAVISKVIKDHQNKVDIKTIDIDLNLEPEALSVTFAIFLVMATFVGD